MLAAPLITSLAGNLATQAYSPTEANISVVLSGDAYCGKDAYLTKTWTGTTAGFVATKVIYSGIVDDTQGYVGYLPSNKSIYVVFRGSSSV